MVVHKKKWTRLITHKPHQHLEREHASTFQNDVRRQHLSFAQNGRTPRCVCPTPFKFFFLLVCAGVAPAPRC